MAHLQHTLHINASVEALDRIVRDPYQWPHFSVGMSEPDKVEGDGGPGSRVEFVQVISGIRLHEIRKTVEERHNPDGSTDWRWEFEGTAPSWMTCHHQPKDGGTQITTDFDYTLPGSVLGKALDRVLVEKLERRNFEQSQENLRLIAESASSI